ncbi:MAG TPA: FAD-dependent oxidoreductase [Bradyrhizobium sp.]|nr:FAD-dependent oxidoreductase [Bradyrhizobium sp.]
MRVVIVGAGISGMCAAWSLIKLGHQVTLIDQGPIPNPLSASGDQHRNIRRAYGPMDNYARAMDQAFDAWEELWADLGENHLVNCGILSISQREGDGGDVARESLMRHKRPFVDLAPKEAAERYPFLDPNGIRRVVFTPEGGVLLCQKIGAGLNEWLSRNGAELRPNTLVSGVDLKAGAITLASGETLSADHVVVTVGAWTPKLLPGISKPLTTYRAIAVYLDTPAKLTEAWTKAPGIQAIGGDRPGYGLPPVAGTELKIASVAFRRPTNDADADRVAQNSEAAGTLEVFGVVLKDIRAYGVKRVYTCAYTFTNDEHFWRHWEGKGVVVSACSGHGYKYGAAIGRWIGWAVDRKDGALLNSWLRAEAEPPRVRA